MQTRLIDKEATRAKFEVTVPADEVSQTFDSVLRAIARQVRVPGFRPGKAPRGVLVKRVGEDALAQEVRDALLEKHYPQAVRELELSPLHAHFHAHEPSEGEDYHFEVEVDLYPDVQLPDLQDIVIDSAAQEVSEDMVASAVAELQREHATLVPVERGVEAGDYVLVESLASGEPSGNVLPIDLERVSPELGEQLLGKAIGDEVDLQFGTGAESEAEDGSEDAEGAEAEGAGARSSLKVIVKDVKEKEKPAADDEFAATLGFEAWDEVLAQVRKNLEAQLEADAFERQREEFVDKLVAESKLELPESLVNRRKAQLLSDLSEELKGNGMTLERYLETLEAKDGRAGFEAELQESAEAAVRRDLVLEKLLETRGSTVSDEEFGEALRYMAARRGQEVSRFRSEMGENWLENYRFLLARDKAVREAVRELLGENEGGPPEAADVAEEAPEQEA